MQLRGQQADAEAARLGNKNPFIYENHAKTTGTCP